MKITYPYQVTFIEITTGKTLSVLKCSAQAAHAYLRKSLKPENWPIVIGQGHVKNIEVKIEKLK